MIFKKMHCKGGVFIPNADVHRRGEVQTDGHGGGGGTNLETTADVFVNGPLRPVKQAPKIIVEGALQLQ